MLADRRGIHLPAIPSTPVSAAVREKSMAQIDSLPLAAKKPPQPPLPTGTVNQFPHQKLINNCSLEGYIEGWVCRDGGSRLWRGRRLPNTFHGDQDSK